jgi:hypothetical protein
MDQNSAGVYDDAAVAMGTVLKIEQVSGQWMNNEM